MRLPSYYALEMGAVAEGVAAESGVGTEFVHWHGYLWAVSFRKVCLPDATQVQ